MNPPLCADCANLIGVRSDLHAAKGWKCGAPENIIGKSTDPVSGLEDIQYLVKTCYDARGADAWCGVAGKWYKVYKHSAGSVRRPQGAAPSADTLLGELGL